MKPMLPLLSSAESREKRESKNTLHISSKVKIKTEVFRAGEDSVNSAICELLWSRLGQDA